MVAIAACFSACTPDQTLTHELPSVGTGQSENQLLDVKPTSVLLTGIGVQANVQLNDNEAAQVSDSKFTVTGCTGIVATNLNGFNPTLTITSVKVGTCTIHVDDTFGPSSADIGVTVNSLTVPVN